jgi:hypothetical protein
VSSAPRNQPSTEEEATEARTLIGQLWPEHVAHLSPVGSKMGSGAIDPVHGVVCNCGEVLGNPVQDPPEDLWDLGEPGSEADPVEAGWNDLMAEQGDRPGILPDGRQLTPWGDYEDPDREITEEEAFAALASPNVPDDVADQATAVLAEQADAAGYGNPEGPEGPPWETSDAPGPTKVETTGGGKDHDLPEGWQDAAREGFENNPAAVAYAKKHAEMEARLAANPMDVAARSFVHGGMDSSGDPVRPEHDDPADEHAARRETVVDLPPMPDELAGPEDDRNDMYAVSPRGELPVRPLDSGVIPQDPLSARVATINPSLPYSPADVELQLLEVENKLERGIHWQRYWEERAAAGELEWEITYNKARAAVIGHGGSEKDRHALCLQNPDVEMALRERHLASAMVRMVRESMHNLRSLQSGYQTLSRSVGDSYRGRQPGA